MSTPSDIDGAPPSTMPPDPDALLRTLGAMLDEADLRAIAEADHALDVADHLAALRAIARGGAVPSPLPWCPREVLQLTGWGSPGPEFDEERELWRRAFACCALLRAYGDAESRATMFGEDATLAGLVASLHALSALPPPRARRKSVVERAALAAARRRGPLAQVDAQAAALLAWLAPRVSDAREPQPFGVALLWFALAAESPAAGLAALVDWTLRAGDGLDAPPRPWRLGVDGQSQRGGTWRAIGELLPDRLRPEHGPAVAEGVRRIARRLAPPDAPTVAQLFHATHRGAEKLDMDITIPEPPPTVPPDPDALLAALGAGLEPSDWLVIAAADFGRDAPAHHAALLGLVRGRGVPKPLRWEPREVLELTRWEEPCDAAGHRRRAFACCVLLRAFGDPENWDDLWRQNATLSGLVDSLDSLDALAPPALDREAAALLAWLMPRLPGGAMGEHAFFGLALLWFALALDVPDAALSALLDWTMAAEDAVAAPWRAELGAPMLGDWLLPRNYGQRDGAWRALGARLPGRLRAHHGAAVADGVRLVAAMLADGAAVTGVDGGSPS